MTNDLSLPEDLAFPFRQDGAGGALCFYWPRFRWQPLTGYRDHRGYWHTSWTERNEERVGHKHKRDKVHRVIWRLYNGPIPPGLEIDHIDGDPGNNNISNLRLVTHAENIRFAMERLGRWGARPKLQPHQVALTIQMPSNANWRFWADRWGVHKVRLLSIRVEAKKKSA